MAGLRWILLGAGIALILGLWWWETRKVRNPAPAPQGVAPEPYPAPVHEAAPAPDTAPIRSYEAQREPVPRRPPVIEIPDDLEVDVSDFVSLERRVPQPVPEFVLEADPGPVAEFPADAQEPGTSAMTGDGFDEEPDDHHRAPWVRTQPLDREQVAPKLVEEEIEYAPDDPLERRAAEASRQRIVALRLVAPAEPWSGADLRGALDDEGLDYGPFSIFHRPREDGKSLMYVASMMEPGSFDLDRMDETTFPGVSLFGVVPGPLDAPATFDLILAVGRALAERLKGQLQDEQGSTLTAQRILNLREELVHFEHRNRRLRRS